MQLMLRFVFLCLLIVVSCSYSLNKSERYFQERWCEKHAGQVEFTLPDSTRVDCLTKTHAIEFDFAGKWEALEQGLHYGRMTGKRPGIVFICRKKGDFEKVERTKANIQFYRLPVKIWTINCG